MHCSQRIIPEILHCLTPTDSSLKYFLSKTLFCSQHLLFVYRHTSPIENECQVFFLILFINYNFPSRLTAHFPHGSISALFVCTNARTNYAMPNASPTAWTKNATTHAIRHCAITVITAAFVPPISRFTVAIAATHGV